MYGSDYPMPLPGGGWSKYYGRFLQTVRGNSDLAPLEDALFRENGKAFLGLRSFLELRGSDLTAEQIQALSRFA